MNEWYVPAFGALIVSGATDWVCFPILVVHSQLCFCYFLVLHYHFNYCS